MHLKDIHAFEPFWGDWYIERELGHGSYGTVYLASKKAPQRVYYAAIKHIPIPADPQETKALYTGGYAADQAMIQSYYEQMASGMTAEIDACYALKGHTNIVSYEEHSVIPRVGEPGFDLFIKMEYLTPLSDYIVGRTLTVGDVVRMGEDICTALMVLRHKHFIHRDIKPGNIFINDVGNFKIGDFGVVRTMERAFSGMSEKGTYEFMAPEVRQGGEASYQVDLYSLGIMMYKLLNGNRSPFLPLAPVIPTRSQMEEAKQRRFSGEPLPPPLHGDDALREIVRKACVFRKEERWADAAEMKEQLSAYRCALTPEQAGEVVLQYERERELGGSGSPGEPAQKENTALRATTVVSPEFDLTEEPTPRVFLDGGIPPRPKTPKPSIKLVLIAAGVALVVLVGGLLLAFSAGIGSPVAPSEVPVPTLHPYDPQIDGIIWTNKTVEEKVRAALDGTEEALFPDEVAQVTTLSFGPEDGLSSLDDFVWLQGLERIRFDGIRTLEDWRGLLTIPSLTSLELQGCAFVDWTVLSQLLSLSELTVVESGCTDGSPFSKMTLLQHLELRKNEIADVAFVTGLSNLRYLGLADNLVSDVAPLSWLRADCVMDLSGRNPVGDWSPVAGILEVTGRPETPVVVVPETVSPSPSLSPSRSSTPSQKPKVTPSPIPSEVPVTIPNPVPIPKETPKPPPVVKETPAPSPSRPTVIGVSSVSVSPGSAVMEPGGTIHLSATVTPADATVQTVKWSSSNSSIAAVDSSGNVTGKGSGTVIITASCGGRSASCAITVE